MRVGTVVVLTVLAGAGLVGGLLLLIAPDGSSLGLDAAILPDWYPGDYLLPGLFLVLVFGLGSCFAAVAVLRRRRFGWLAVTGLGAVLVLWMITQVAMIGLILPPMQIGFALVGIVLILLGELARRAQSSSERANRIAGE